MPRAIRSRISWHSGIVADVVIDGGRLRRPRLGQGQQGRRLLRGRRQRLLADHMAAGLQHAPGLVEMVSIGRCHVDDPDPIIVQEFAEVG